MPRSCVTLLSGGLDSLLALRLMTLQGLAATAVHTINCFHGSEAAEARKERLRADALRLGARDIVFPDITDEVIAVTRAPRFGYGRHRNACIDCRLRTIAAGFRVMREVAADFVASGEVVGQRPMSQRRDAIAIADREIASWGFPGLLLRPLSAKLLEKTVPEAEGWVDQGRLYAISGRSRGEQMALARELAIGPYPAPAGGCLLTDAGFSARLGDLMRFHPGWGAADVELLKVGRHFLPAERTRIVASRNEAENARLEELARPDDLFYINAERNGAVVMLRGEATAAAETLAAGLAIHFSRMREAGHARVARWRLAPGETDRSEFAAAATPPEAAWEAESAMKAAGPCRTGSSRAGPGSKQRAAGAP